jgi:hypothetical protein
MYIRRCASVVVIFAILPIVESRYRALLKKYTYTLGMPAVPHGVSSFLNVPVHGCEADISPWFRPSGVRGYVPKMAAPRHSRSYAGTSDV